MQRRSWQLPVLLALVFGAGLGIGNARRRVTDVIATKKATAAPNAAPACGAKIADALAHNRWLEAEAATKGCDDPASVANVRFVQGDFARASADFVAARRRDPARRVSVTETEAHLFANDLERAASSASQMLTQFYPGPDTAEKEAFRCIVKQIEALPRRADYPCVTPRTSAQYRMHNPFVPFDRAVDNPFSAYVGTRGRLRGRPLAIERAQIDERSPGDPSVAAFSAELALFYEWSGASAHAEPLFRILDRVAIDITSGGFSEEDAPHMKAAMSVAAAAALYRLDDERMRRYARLGEAHSAGVVLQVRRTLDPKNPWEPQIEDDHWEDHRTVFDAGRTGDGVELAAALVTLHTTGGDTLARVFPRIQRNQDVVRAWFDREFPAPCLDCGVSELLGHLVQRRNVAAVLGRDAEVETLVPAIARLSDARLEERTAYAVDALETFFSPP